MDIYVYEVTQDTTVFVDKIERVPKEKKFIHINEYPIFKKGIFYTIDYEKGVLIEKKKEVTQEEQFRADIDYLALMGGVVL